MDLALTIVFSFSAIFWAYVTFKDARWVGNEEGPSVWNYAFFGVLMFAASVILAAFYFIAWLL